MGTVSRVDDGTDAIGEECIEGLMALFGTELTEKLIEIKLVLH